jgi:hypothetical protein
MLKPRKQIIFNQLYNFAIEKETRKQEANQTEVVEESKTIFQKYGADLKKDFSTQNQHDLN